MNAFSILESLETKMKKLNDDKFIINDVNQESLNMILLFIVIELNLN